MIASIYRTAVAAVAVWRGHQNENNQIDMKIETMARRVAIEPQEDARRRSTDWSVLNWAELN